MNSPAPTPTDNPPPLWNPGAAASWSLLFTPAFGAWLHARNADVLGRPEEAKTNRIWFAVSLMYLGFVVVSTFVPTMPDAGFRLAALALLLGWYFGAGRGQVRHVRGVLGNRYQRRSWRKPLLMGFGSLIAFFIVVLALALAAETLAAVAA